MKELQSPASSLQCNTKTWVTPRAPQTKKVVWETKKLESRALELGTRKKHTFMEGYPRERAPREDPSSCWNCKVPSAVLIGAGNLCSEVLTVWPPPLALRMSLSTCSGVCSIRVGCVSFPEVPVHEKVQVTEGFQTPLEVLHSGGYGERKFMFLSSQVHIVTLLRPLTSGGVCPCHIKSKARELHWAEDISPFSGLILV